MKFEFGEQIKKARKEALNPWQFFWLKDEYRNILIREIRGDLTEEEKEKSKEIVERMEKTGVKATTLPEFRALLEQIGLTKKNVQKILSHENAHANMAEQLGGKHHGYYVDFVRIPYLLHLIRPIVDVDPAENSSSEEKKEFWEKVLKAPEIMGEDKLSPGDKAVLKKFEKQL